MAHNCKGFAGFACSHCTSPIRFFPAPPTHNRAARRIYCYHPMRGHIPCFVRKESLCVGCGACSFSVWRSLPPYPCPYPCARLPVCRCPRRRNGRTGRCRFAAIRGRSLRRYHGSGALRIGSAPLRSDPRTGRRALSDSAPCHPCRPRRSRSDLRRMDRGAAGRPWRISSRQLPCPALLLRRDPFLCHRASDVTTDGSVPGNFEKMCGYPL